MNGQNQKGNNKKLILLFVGLIVIGIVYMKLKKTEHQENKQQPPQQPPTILTQFQNALGI